MNAEAQPRKSGSKNEKKYRDYHYFWPRGVMKLLFGIQIFFAFIALLMLLFPRLTACLDGLRYLYPQGLTSASGITGITAVLFVWLIQRASNQECGVAMTDLYRWISRFYGRSFIIFAITTLLTVYLGNSCAYQYTWPITALFISTLSGIVSMCLLSRYFIFQRSSRRKIAHCYLDERIFKRENATEEEREQSLNLLLGDMPSCMESGDFLAARHILDVIEDWDKERNGDPSQPEDFPLPMLALNSAAAKRTRIWSSAWDKMLDQASPAVVELLLHWGYQNALKQYASARSVSLCTLAWFIKISDLYRSREKLCLEAVTAFLERMAADAEQSQNSRNQNARNLLSCLTKVMIFVEHLENKILTSNRKSEEECNPFMKKLYHISSLLSIPPLEQNELKQLMGRALYIYAASRYWTETDAVQQEENIKSIYKETFQGSLREDGQAEDEGAIFYENESQQAGVPV